MGTSPERREGQRQVKKVRERLGDDGGSNLKEERRDRIKRSEIGLAMIGAATLKKKGSNPSDPDVVLGVKFKELL